MNIFYVYALIDLRTNLPFYIGKGNRNRYSRHFNETKETTSNIQKFNKIQYLKSIGYEVPVVKLYENLDEETAYYIEEFFIWKYGRKNLDENGILTNIDFGGRKRPRGYVMTAETKMKISLSNKGRKVSDITRKKISIANSGSSNGMYGTKCNPSTEIRNKISQRLLKSEKFLSSRKSDEYRKKISKSQSKPTYLLAQNLNIIKTYNNCREIADELGFTYGNIKNARRDKRLVDNRYYIVYAEDYDNFVKESYGDET